MDRVERPLSPHLQVYRPQITSVLSILHRGTGLALSAGLLVLVYWLTSLAAGPQAYTEASALLAAAWIKPFYVVWCACFFYHLANGIRHLAWDLGYGFGRAQIVFSGWLVVFVTVLVTLIYSTLTIF
jgi:succinate dehydrogenase / fumarate reductase cytochrome b subunit